MTAFGVAAGIAPVAWQKRRLLGGWALLILSLVASWWTFTYGLGLGASGLNAKLRITGLESGGIVSVPLAWFCFILHYSSHGRWLTPRRLADLAVIPAASVALVWTHGWHGLVQTNLSVDSSGPFLAVRQTHGPWFWVYYGYAAALLLSATYALVLGFPKSLRLHRRQVALLVAVFAPWTVSLLHIAHIDAVHRFDLTPAAFSLSSVALVWGLRRAGLFAPLPVARDFTIREIGRGMLLVSRELAILDANLAAVRRIGADRRALVGRLLAEVLPALRDVAGFFDGSDAILHVEGATHPNGEAVSAETARATRRNDPLACVMIDVDDFKQVNDCLGHQVGDRALQDIGRILHANVRSYDLVIRCGGTSSCSLFRNRRPARRALPSFAACSRRSRPGMRSPRCPSLSRSPWVWLTGPRARGGIGRTSSRRPIDPCTMTRRSERRRRSEEESMATVRITVVKRAFHQDLSGEHIRAERYPEGFGPCSLWAEGQTFLVEGFPKKPEGFPCDWAWADIQRDVAMIAFGADLPWMKEKGTAVTCCSDGFRPVSFLVERIEG